MVAHGGSITLRDTEIVEGAGLALTLGGELTYNGPYITNHCAVDDSIVVAPALDHESLIEKVC